MMTYSGITNRYCVARQAGMRFANSRCIQFLLVLLFFPQPTNSFSPAAISIIFPLSSPIRCLYPSKSIVISINTCLLTLGDPPDSHFESEKSHFGKLKRPQANHESHFWNHESRLGNHESLFWNQESRLGNHESHFRNQESRLGNHESHFWNQESRLGNHESHFWNHESRLWNLKERAGYRERRRIYHKMRFGYLESRRGYHDRRNGYLEWPLPYPDRHIERPDRRPGYQYRRYSHHKIPANISSNNKWR